MIRYLLIAFLLTSVLGILAVSYANFRFRSTARKEAKQILDTHAADTAIITMKMIASLPPVIQKWLVHSGVPGTRVIHTVRLKQKGLLRTKPGGKWMPVDAEQYFNTDNPAFLWLAKIDAGLFNIDGKDRYENGKGNMIIKVASIITVANANGKEIDQGTLIRYLAEIQWFPSIALSTFITWQQINDTTAIATISYGDLIASGTFSFDSSGDLVKFEAQRYMEHNGTYSMETWSVPVTSHKTCNNTRIPVKGNTIWKLIDGDFDWFKWEITEIEYNNPDLY